MIVLLTGWMKTVVIVSGIVVGAWVLLTLIGLVSVLLFSRRMDRDFDRIHRRSRGGR